MLSIEEIIEKTENNELNWDLKLAESKIFCNEDGELVIKKDVKKSEKEEISKIIEYLIEKDGKLLQKDIIEVPQHYCTTMAVNIFGYKCGGCNFEKVLAQNPTKMMQLYDMITKKIEGKVDKVLHPSYL